MSSGSTIIRSKFKNILSIIILFGVLALPTKALATAYYVSNSGSDSKDGKSEATAWATVSKINSSSFSAGDKILFKNGNSWNSSTLTITSSGSGVGNEITISNYGTGSSPVISSPSGPGIKINNKKYIILDGINCQNTTDRGIEITDSSYITLRNIYITKINTDSGAITLLESADNGLTHDILVEDFQIVGGGSMGWGFSGSPYPIKNIIIRRGTIDGVGQAGGQQKHGIYMTNWQNFLVEDLVINDSYNMGIKMVGTTQDGVIRRVTIKNSGLRNGTNSSGPGVGLGDGGDNINRITFENNVMYGNYHPAINGYSDANNITINHNTFYNNLNGVWVVAGGTGWVVTNNITVQDYSFTNSMSKMPLNLAGTDADISNNTFKNNIWLYTNGTSTLNPVRIGTTTYSLSSWQAKSGSPDLGSLSIDPKFVSPSTGDFHLQSSSAGCKSDGTYIGAFPCAISSSPSPSPSAKPGDANNNGIVDGVDYVIWLNHYKQTLTGGPSVGDFNASGTVDGVDYVIWLNNYKK